MPVITAKLAHKLFQRFQRREESAFGTERSALLLDALDVAYVVSNLWRRRDTVTEQVMGKGQQPTLSRWDATKVSCLLCTVTLYANLAHSLTRSP